MIIFDLDGTLSIVGDRIKYLERPTAKKDWDAFYSHCGEDNVNKPIALLYDTIVRTNRNGVVKVVTGRRESTRETTLEWFSRYGLLLSTENLLMRPDNDYRHDTLVKPELVKDFLHQITMVFEDRTSMVNKWRELGITCLQVAEGNF